MGHIDIPQKGFKIVKDKKRMEMGQKFDPNQRIEVQKVIVHPGEVELILILRFMYR